MLRVAAHANLRVRAAVVRRLRADKLLAGKAPRLLASEEQLRGSAVSVRKNNCNRGINSLE